MATPPLKLPSYHGCYEIERDPATPDVLIALLVLSNLVFLIPSRQAYRVRHYFKSAVFLGVAIFSSFYHMCKPLNGWFCLLPYPLLYAHDFILAFINIPIIAYWFLPFEYPLYRTYTNMEEFEADVKRLTGSVPIRDAERESASTAKVVYVDYKPVIVDTGIVGKDVILYLFFILCIITLIGLDMVNIYGYLILVGLTLLSTFGIFLHIYLRFRVLPPLRIKYVILAAVFLVLGSVSFMVQPKLLEWVANTQDPEYSYAVIYGIIHSFWHAAAALAQYFFLTARLYIGSEEEDETAGPEGLSGDFHHEIYVLNIIRDKYKNPLFVRDVVQLKRKQELSPWTLYMDDSYSYHPATLVPYWNDHKKKNF